MHATRILSEFLRRPAAVLALAVLPLAVSGCAGTEPAGSTEAIEEPAAAADPVEIKLVDYAFVGLPDTVAPGTRLTVVNDAPSELHELVAFRLSDDEERTLEELVELPPADLTEALGAPVTVLLASPGGDEIAAVGDGTLIEPGRYAILCFIPTGADPEEYLQAAAATDEGPPQVEGGPPHFVRGMTGELTVEG